MSCKQIAIIGATASGKTSLAIDMAKAHNGVIFSIDSLAVYKEMDIVSAKPSKKEQDGIMHYGLDILDVPEHFSVSIVIDLYYKALAQAEIEGKNLIIVGGSSFYLKTLLTGLSEHPHYTEKTKAKTQEMMQDLAAVHKLLKDKDPQSVEKIAANDKYRLEKLLLLLNETGIAPSTYFKEHQPEPIIKDLTIFELQSDRTVLRDRIALRTKLMLDDGLIDEIAYLEKKFQRNHTAMKAIGVVETLQYLDCEISIETLKTLITTHTAQLAKRQTTFNKTQFQETIKGDARALALAIDSFYLKDYTDV